MLPPRLLKFILQTFLTFIISLLISFPFQDVDFARIIMEKGFAFGTLQFSAYSNFNTNFLPLAQQRYYFRQTQSRNNSAYDMAMLGIFPYMAATNYYAFGHPNIFLQAYGHTLTSPGGALHSFKGKYDDTFTKRGYGQINFTPQQAPRSRAPGGGGAFVIPAFRKRLNSHPYSIYIYLDPLGSPIFSSHHGPEKLQIYVQ